MSSNNNIDSMSEVEQEFTQTSKNLQNANKILTK